MSTQTVTRAIESDTPPSLIYSKLADASLIPQWAPVFADRVEPAHGNSFRVTKGNETFHLDVLLNEASLTVDYLRSMANGKRGGAYIRVMPRPISGSVITMTVPVAPTTTPAEVATVLEQELQALLKLAD
ncbi:MAG TPA: hypothetical protein VL495_08025 [Edaphobacter sp.]|nr:hypothetical protein [Edaphobacter sp.]